MNYEEILTEEVAERFRKEGATNAIITLVNKTTDKREGYELITAIVVRDIDISLEKGIFHVAGKTVQSAALMKERFLGGSLHGKVWYPFEFLYKENHQNPERTLAIIAKVIGVNSIELEWMFINEH